MEMKSYRPGDETEILELFLKAFRKPLSHGFWQWRFEKNPFVLKPMISLMWENEILAGHYAVSGTELSIDGKIHLFSLSGTTMTSPGFEGKGIFSSLALDLYDRVANDPGVTGVMGFPNQKSHYALVKKIHWKDLNILTNFSISGTKAGMRQVPGMQLISRFDQRHADFIHQAISDLGFSVFVNRSAAYLNWRYLDCPVQDYDCFEYISNNEIKGIIVTKSFDSFQHAGHKEADILEIFCAPQEDVIKDLLAGAGYFYASREVHIFQMNSWISIMDARHLLMEKLGFVNGGPLTFFCTKSFISGADQIYDYRNWYLSLGDSDVF